MTDTSGMPRENVEQFFTPELQQRYGVTKSVVSARLNALRIQPQKDGKKFYINHEQLQLMDALNSHLENGGSTDEFVRQQIATGEIVLTQAQTILVSPEAQTTTIKPQPQQELVATEAIASPESGGQEMLAQLQAQKGEQVCADDIQEVDERSQRRAFTKAMAEETLTSIYEATEEFTIPELKEQLDKHREVCRQARGKRTVANNLNDFLSKSLAFQAQAVGTNGSTVSTSCNSNQLPTSNSVTMNT